MKYRIDNQIALREHPKGPLVPVLKGFADQFWERQYARRTIKTHLRNVVQFSAWLEQEDVDLHQLCAIQVERFLQSIDGGGRSNLQCSLRHLLEYLNPESINEPPPRTVCELTPSRRCLLDYEHYLSAHRGLATKTVRTYVRRAGEFLHHCFGPDKANLSALQFADVLSFVHDEAARWKGRPSMKQTPRMLRSFLRYVHVHAEGMPDLAAQVPAVASWAKTSVPRAIEADQVERLLTSVERTTAKGRRDYAILLLLARLGLRAREVAFLSLDDIDWGSATLTVTLKGTRRSTYPLTMEIGEALRDYLLNGRPPSNDRRMFLRSNVPYRGFSSSASVSGIVGSCIERAGIDAPTKGAHQLRHGLACEMLRKGCSLEEIGNVLGHQHPDSTMIYAKVDISAMRALSLPWPGGDA